MKPGCPVDHFVQCATGEYYRTLCQLRLFEHDLTVDYEPEKINKIQRFPFRRMEGQTVTSGITCKYCDYVLAEEKERRLLSMPSDEWDVLQFGCCELKTKFGKRTKKSVSINVLLHSALWIEIRDCQDNIEQDDEDLAKTDTHCPECGNFIGTAGRLFLPTVRVRLEEKKEDAAALIVVVDERLESCLAEKILELAQIRPIFRFTLLAHHITVEHLDALLQFGKGKCFEPCVKIRLERSAHPVNESLVAIELEEEPREGMTIPFPTQFKAELDCLFRDNRAQLAILGPDISFLRYKSRPVIL